MVTTLPSQPLGAAMREAGIAAFRAGEQPNIIQVFDAGADAVILDLRYNPGGSDDVALAYARFFTDQPVTALTKTTRTPPSRRMRSTSASL